MYKNQTPTITSDGVRADVAVGKPSNAIEDEDSAQDSENSVNEEIGSNAEKESSDSEGSQDECIEVANVVEPNIPIPSVGVFPRKTFSAPPPTEIVTTVTVPSLKASASQGGGGTASRATGIPNALVLSLAHPQPNRPTEEAPPKDKQGLFEKEGQLAKKQRVGSNSKEQAVMVPAELFLIEAPEEEERGRRQRHPRKSAIPDETKHIKKKGKKGK